MKRRHQEAFEYKDSTNKKSEATATNAKNQTIRRAQNVLDIAPKLYPTNNGDLVIDSIKSFFTHSTQVKEFIEYKNYEIFDWLLKYEDMNTIKYLFDTTKGERAKFSLVSENNYALVKKIVDIFCKEMREDRDNIDFRKKVLEALVSLAPGIVPKQINDMIPLDQQAFYGLETTSSNTFEVINDKTEVKKDPDRNIGFVEKIEEKRNDAAFKVPSFERS